MDAAPGKLDDLHPEFTGLPPTSGLVADLFSARHAFGRVATATAIRVMPVRRVANVRVDTVRTGGARLRSYTPAIRRTDAVLLWIHGGGMVSGHPRMDDLLCSEVAAGLGMRVVGSDYRLAPRHPFPAALDDLERAWDAVANDHTETRIVVGGQSAGGGLAAALVQRLHDRGGPQPVGQWLFCPMLDDRTAGDRRLDALDHPVWNNTLNRFGWGAFLNAAPGAESVPAGAVPARREDLHGLPPAWLGVGTVDLFHGEGVEYARRLTDAGVPTTLDVVTGGPHAFETLVPDSPLSRAYRTRALQWLAALVGAEVRDDDLQRA